MSVLIACYASSVVLAAIVVRAFAVYRVATDEALAQRIESRRKCMWCSPDYTCGYRHRLPVWTRTWFVFAAALAWPIALLVWSVNRVATSVAGRAATAHNEQIEQALVMETIDRELSSLPPTGGRR